MAKRPDFAQKLLDDIRLRKEKMGLAPSGRQSAQAPSGSAGNVKGISQRSLQRRKETTNNLLNKNNTEVTKIWLSTGKHKVPNYDVGSQDVVPFRRSAHADHSVDVSMALALALSNSGKLRNIEFFSNATVGKKNIMHHGSLNFAETGRSMPNRSRHPSNQFPFPNLDVAEVSKGVKKLNKILEACTSGLRFDGNSIDFGRELLRGALDLEESLRMLVTLQDASDYMVGSQRKQVRLLKGKEDDESSSHKAKERKSMSRPRFSFDEPRQHSHNLPKEKNGDSYLEHKRSAIFYLEKSKTPASNSNMISSNASMNPTHQKRSPSCGPGSDPQFSCITTSYSNSGEHRSFKNENGKVSTPRNLKQPSDKSIPTGEKIRIPNVIAKLMGLEELPLINTELKKEMDVNKISVKEAENKTTGAQKMPQSKKVTDMDKISATDAENKKEADGMRYLVKEQYHMDSQKNNLQEKINTGKRVVTPEAVRRKEIQKQRDQNGIEDSHSTPKHEAHPHLKVTKKKGIETTESKNSEDQARKGKAESILNSDKSLPEDNIQSTASLPHIWHDDAASKKELAQRKKGQDLEGKKNIEAIPTNETKTVNNKVAPQQLITHRLKSDQAVHGSPKDKRHNERHTPKANLENERDLKLKNRSTQKPFSGNSPILVNNRSSINMTNKEKPKVHAENHQAQKPVKSRNTIYKDGERNSDINLGEVGTLKLGARTVKEKTAPLLLEPVLKKPEKIPSANKVHTTKGIAYRKGSDSNRESDPRRTKTTHENHQPLKDHSSFLQELEHRWKQRNHKVEGSTIGSHLMDSSENLKQNTETESLSCSSTLGDDCGEPLSTDKKLAAETHVNESSNITNTASAAQEPQEIAPECDVERKPILEENHSKGPTESVQISNTSSLKNQAISKVDGQLSLTKNEQLLKQTLVSNRDFLNTAQAVFKIKIPVDILQASEDSCIDEGRKLILDCAYEVTRRKGKREEVMFTKKMSTAPVKLRCMDTLIKELNEDVESLKFTGKIESDDSDIARYLNELIEREIQNRNPDVNSMWDFGWNNSTFADIENDEIRRDVEKHVLNGLITELAIDLSNVCQC